MQSKVFLGHKQSPSSSIDAPLPDSQEMVMVVEVVVVVVAVVVVVVVVGCIKVLKITTDLLSLQSAAASLDESGENANDSIHISSPRSSFVKSKVPSNRKV